MVYMPQVQKNSMVQIGDYVPRAGIYTKPGVIVEKKENGDVVVDTSDEMIKKYHRHSITTGLTVEDKDRFNAIMDNVIEMKENDERINALQRTIDELKMDPASKKVANALKNEQAQLIRSSRELPKVYEVAGDKVR